jgi:two-component system alkaline phosphatase synthesis response regulator PhoP
VNRPRVLFVEDANISRRKFVALIKSLDCDVKEASDGEMALLFANSFLPHLILLDLHMPKRNGISVLEILRSDHRFKKTIIVILTGDANMKVVQLAISKGANDYLLKSDTLANLKARLLEHINAIRQQDD